MSQSVGIVQRVASTVLPTRWGYFRTVGFKRWVHRDDSRVETAVALILGNPAKGAALVRIHSQCFTGDVLGSQRCDCGQQLDFAMRAIASEGSGVLIYEQQEGRGIGLMGKLQAYALQDRGLDTVEANRALGFRADCRDFRLPVAVLRDLGINRVRLLSNNPAKIRALVSAGIDVAEQLPCEVHPNPHAILYLRTKKEKMGHALTLV
jgi:GTP cyclohydrolase II